MCLCSLLLEHLCNFVVLVVEFVQQIDTSTVKHGNAKQITREF